MRCGLGFGSGFGSDLGSDLGSGFILGFSFILVHFGSFSLQFRVAFSYA